MERQSSRCCLCRLYFRKRRAPEQALLTGTAPHKAAFLLHALIGSQADRQRWIRAIWMQRSFRLGCKACQEMCCMLKCQKIKTGCNMAGKGGLSCCRLHSGRCAGHLEPAFHRSSLRNGWSEAAQHLLHSGFFTALTYLLLKCRLHCWHCSGHVEPAIHRGSLWSAWGEASAHMGHGQHRSRCTFISVPCRTCLHGDLAKCNLCYALPTHCRLRMQDTIAVMHTGCVAVLEWDCCSSSGLLGLRTHMRGS